MLFITVFYVIGIALVSVHHSIPFPGTNPPERGPRQRVLTATFWPLWLVWKAIRAVIKDKW